jgi:hypothetical protein
MAMSGGFAPGLFVSIMARLQAELDVTGFTRQMCKNSIRPVAVHFAFSPGEI